VILDAGVLIAAERDDALARSYFATADRLDIALHTSEAVVAQVWRGGARQVHLGRVLRTVECHPLDDGRAVGRILRDSGTTDVVDAHLGLLVQRLGDDILTGDVDDLTRVMTALEPPAVASRRPPMVLPWPPPGRG
jgi:hypothetical protein